MYSVYNMQSPPMAELYINLSPPCGDTSDDYVERERIPINKLYKKGSCSFEMNDKKIHPSFIDTGFRQSEYSVL